MWPNGRGGTHPFYSQMAEFLNVALKIARYESIVQNLSQQERTVPLPVGTLVCTVLYQVLVSVACKYGYLLYVVESSSGNNCFGRCQMMKVMMPIKK